MKYILFDDDVNNSDPNIDKNIDLGFVHVPCNQDHFGMTTKQINRYTKYIKGQNTLKIAFFDWDCTLSRLEYVDYDSYLGDKKKESTSYLGKDARISSLKTLFLAMREKRIKIYILTRNPTGKYNRSKHFFVELVNKIEGNKKFGDKHVLYTEGATKSKFIKNFVKQKKVAPKNTTIPRKKRATAKKKKK